MSRSGNRLTRSHSPDSRFQPIVAARRCPRFGRLSGGRKRGRRARMGVSSFAAGRGSSASGDSADSQVSHSSGVVRIAAWLWHNRFHLIVRRFLSGFKTVQVKKRKRPDAQILRPKPRTLVTSLRKTTTLSRKAHTGGGIYEDREIFVTILASATGDGKCRRRTPRAGRRPDGNAVPGASKRIDDIKARGNLRVGVLPDFPG